MIVKDFLFFNEVIGPYTVSSPVILAYPYQITENLTLINSPFQDLSFQSHFGFSIRSLLALVSLATISQHVCLHRFILVDMRKY